MKHVLIVLKGSWQIFLTGCAIIALVVTLAPQALLADDKPLILEDNLKVLKANAPDENYRFVGSNAPGQLFLPKEQATLNRPLIVNGRFL